MHHVLRQPTEVLVNLAQLMQPQALRSTVELEPIDGKGGRLFPPTYPYPEGTQEARDRKARHVVEDMPGGGKRVLVDSVASQANRQEAALVAARRAKLIDFADVYIDLSKTVAEMPELSATELPHRLSDAILRDSDIGGIAFGKSDLGKAILGARLSNLTALIEASPTTLLYGCWFSQHKAANPLKVQRSVVSEIWAEGATLGKAVGSRIDPLGIEIVPLYAAPDGDWTASEHEAEMVKGQPKAFKKKPSELNHGNIAPSIRDQGITAEAVRLRWAMPLAALRRLRFGSLDRDAAGQAYIAALGVMARVLDHAAGYSLRSRCDLIGTGPVQIEAVGFDGQSTFHTVDVEAALGLLAEAEAGMKRAGLKLQQRTMATAGRKLTRLIAANLAAQQAGTAAESA